VRVLLKSPTLPLLVGLALAGLTVPVRVGAQSPVARAVLFYSPTCPHCHKVMTEDLPPLVERYGERLVIVGVDVTSRAGQEMFQAALDHFGIPADQAGVPMLVAGEEVMIGSLEIPQRFPGLIERALAADGIDWPDVQPLRAALAAQGLVPEMGPRPDSAPARPRATDTVAATAAPPTAEPPPAPAEPGITRSLTPERAGGLTSVADRLRLDPFGNGIAVAVMVLLVAALAWSIRLALMRAPPVAALPTPPWLVPLLCVLGVAVAAYLSFVEVTGREAVCGPVGDCNAVQQSAYARLFGVLPVGVLGMIGYAAILVTWGVSRNRAGRVAQRGLELQWLMAFVATGFSLYLTFLEPFVIGATCLWCISSAVLVGLLLLTTSVQLRRSGT